MQSAKRLSLPPLVLLMCLVLATVTTHGQQREKAREQIQTLENGFLLVRLHTRSNTIDALRKRGMKAEAQKIKEEQRQENIEILKSFKYVYTFSPVYFIWSDSSHLIPISDPADLPLLNESLEIDTAINPKGNSFLVGDFGITDAGPTGLTVSGFVVRNKNLEQLQDPFPYYTRSYEGLPHERTPVQVVQQFDKKLRKFSNKK